jgi:hypothetical protein
MIEQEPNPRAATATQAKGASRWWLKRNVGTLVGATVVLAGLAYFAAGPYLALLKIRSGVEARDANQIAECVDFPALRQSLKSQLEVAMAKKVAPELENNPFAALGVAFASKLAEGLVDQMVTPEGLARLLAGQKPAALAPGASVAASVAKKPLEGARLSYESLERFVVSVPTDTGEQMKFILTRSGLAWKLSGLELPGTT